MLSCHKITTASWGSCIQIDDFITNITEASFRQARQVWTLTCELNSIANSITVKTTT